MRATRVLASHANTTLFLLLRVSTCRFLLVACCYTAALKCSSKLELALKDKCEEGLSVSGPQSGVGGGRRWGEGCLLVAAGVQGGGREVQAV